MQSRRHLLRMLGITAAAGFALKPGAENALAQDGPFHLPGLPYAFDALEPHIDAQTVRIHHSKHHAGYVAKLNAAVAGHADLQKKSIEEILSNLNALPESIRTAVQNSGGGHANHALYWQIMSPKGGAPKGDVARAIDKYFGTFDKFQAEFSNAGATQFGSGWAWLTVDKSRRLRVEQTGNQITPLSSGRTPILCLDVWEHAYYLKYQNRRADHIEAFQKIINWDRVAELYQLAIS